MGQRRETVRIGVIGVEHAHIFGMVHAVVRAGAELVSFHSEADLLGAGFAKVQPKARAVKEAAEILEDESISLVLGAGVPADRAPVGLEVMRHGKDFLSDKPGVTTLAQLEEVRSVQEETGRIYSICFSERFESRATTRAAELVAQGAIGRVLQTVGLGPHRLNAPKRPPWFFERERYGGILVDIASHQVDQFLHFTGARTARVVAARVANHGHPETPGLQDFGELMLEGENGASGYVRVDWFTPDGLPTWGDTRLTVLGTEGFLEVRKNVDLAGREGGDHLFWADGGETHYVDCSDTPLSFGERLLDDVAQRTQTAMSQEHCFLACELALFAQELAEKTGPWQGRGS